MNLDINTRIRFADGEEAGRITRVVLEPAQNTVHSAVVETPGLISREVVVPVDLLSMAPGDVVQFNGDPDTLDACPDFQEAEYLAPPLDWQAGDYQPGAVFFLGPPPAPLAPETTVQTVPADSVVISQGTAVLCQDGRVGIVDEVVLDADHQFLALIVRPDDEGAPDFRVPRALIARITDGAVRLTCTRAQLPQQVEALIEENEEPEPQDRALL